MANPDNKVASRAANKAASKVGDNKAANRVEGEVRVAVASRAVAVVLRQAAVAAAAETRCSSSRRCCGRSWDSERAALSGDVCIDVGRRRRIDCIQFDETASTFGWVVVCDWNHRLAFAG